MKGKGKTIEESIRIEAYLLSEKAGHPGGMDHYFWTQAEAIVSARAAAVSVAIKAAAIKPVSQRTVKAKAPAKPKTDAKPKAEAKPKAAKKSVSKGVKGKEQQLSLNGEMAATTGKRPSKK